MMLDKPSGEVFDRRFNSYHLDCESITVTKFEFWYIPKALSVIEDGACRNVEKLTDSGVTDQSSSAAIEKFNCRVPVATRLVAGADQHSWACFASMRWGKRKDRHQHDGGHESRMSVRRIMRCVGNLRSPNKPGLL
jgi:hypothetical protein